VPICFAVSFRCATKLSVSTVFGKISNSLGKVSRSGKLETGIPRLRGDSKFQEPDIRINRMGNASSKVKGSSSPLELESTSGD
jgi:hypothetical protein